MQITIHCGPTNSGKTYQSLVKLARARTGAYLGPLRVLALEVFETLNGMGTPCNLLTGEEQRAIRSARHTASTVEMANLNRNYDVVVVDECQLVNDESRGAAWLAAITQVQCNDLELIVAPEAFELVYGLVADRGPVEVVEHERLCPLRYEGTIHEFTEVQPGDAIVVFSRGTVLCVAEEMQELGYRVSCIYGSMPPEARAEEVRRFACGESQIVVATDAIGMGVSLPIRRIIFGAIEKFDGSRRRFLTAAEVRQIAGRAGRFGKYEEGLVAVFDYIDSFGFIQQMLAEPIEQVWSATVPFEYDEEAEESLVVQMKQWQYAPMDVAINCQVPDDFDISMEDLSEQMALLDYLQTEKPELLQDMSDHELLRYLNVAGGTRLPAYWGDLVEAVHTGAQLQTPEEWDVRGMLEDDGFDDELDVWEATSTGLDIYATVCRLSGRKAEIDIQAARTDASKRISAELLRRQEENMLAGAGVRG